MAVTLQWPTGKPFECNRPPPCGAAPTARPAPGWKGGGFRGTRTACPACFGPSRPAPPAQATLAGTHRLPRPPRRAITPSAEHWRCCGRTGGRDGGRPAEAHKIHGCTQAEYAADGERVDRCNTHPCYPFGQLRPGLTAAAEDPALLTPRPARALAATKWKLLILRKHKDRAHNGLLSRAKKLQIAQAARRRNQIKTAGFGQAASKRTESGGV